MDGDGRGQYSTLEVAPQQAPAQKEVVPHSDLPQVVSSPHREYYKPEEQRNAYAAGTPPVAGAALAGAAGAGYGSQFSPSQYTNSQYPNSQYPQSTYPQSQYGGAPSMAAAPIDEKSTPKRICGIAAKSFWIIVAVAIVLVIAIAGGVAGGVTAANRSKQSSDGAAPATGAPAPGAGGNATSPAVAILNTNAKIAAANWTDSKNVQYYAVFTQDKNDAVIVSLWNTVNTTWTTVNVTRALAKVGSPITVKSGSILATTAIGHPGWRFQMNLYYLSPSNAIGEIYTLDMTGQVWAVGGVSKESSRIAADDSQLTALWHHCDYGCANQIYVFYQDKDNKLSIMNSSNWGGTYSIAGTTSTDKGSGLAVIPMITDSGKTNGTNAGELRLYRTVGNMLAEHKMSNTRQWGPGNVLDRDMPAPNPTPIQYAVSSFDGFNQILVVRRDPNGALWTHRWDETSWNKKALNIQGGPANPNFVRISMHGDNRFYGILGDSIHEYRWYPGEPSTFIYVGTVGPLDKPINTS